MGDYRALFRAVLTIATIGAVWLAPQASGQPQERSPSLEDCTIPAELLKPSARSMFTPEQEMRLGDAIAEHVGARYRVVEDPEIQAALQKMGDRIVAQLPDTGIDFKFSIVDLPLPTAFAAVGGRIYLARKLVSLAETEDELAGVIAHEVAHVASQHMVLWFTSRFREVLDITWLTDTSDIRELYHQYVETLQFSPSRSGGRVNEHRNQVQADLVGLYAAAKAGYDPMSLTTMLDRIAGTRGKRGNWFGDILGLTQPASKRLREMDDEIRSFTRACQPEERASSPADFDAFKKLVLTNSSGDRAEELEGLVMKRSLQEPLRTRVRLLRFSPDGRFILAQDDSNIYVYRRDPLELSFHVEAPDAVSAHFTLDSRSLVWIERDLRLEVWDLHRKEPDAVRELTLREGCLHPRLSPSGRVVACFSNAGTLYLYDTVLERVLFSKNDFFSFRATMEGPRPDIRRTMDPKFRRWWSLRALTRALLDDATDVLHMGFSPDGRYFAAAQPPSSSVAFDLENKKDISIRDSIRDVMMGGFTFLEGGRLAGIHPRAPSESRVVTFPEGEVLIKVNFGGKTVSAPSRGNSVLVRPGPDRPLGVFDLDTNAFVLTSAEPAFDIYDDVFVNERRSGVIRLYRRGEMHDDGAVDVEALASAELPLSGLGRLRAVAMSRDLGLVAYSERTSGGIWNVQTGERYLRSRGFHGAWFGGGGTMYADFPPMDDAPRRIIALSPNGPRDGPPMEAFHLRQIDDLLIGVEDGEKRDVLEARRVSDLEPLWRRELEQDSRMDLMMRLFATSDTVALVWPSGAKSAKKLIESDESLKTRLRALDDTDFVPVVELVDARSGQSVGTLLVEHVASSRYLSGVQRHEDTVVVSLEDRRVLVYSLTTGELVARLFGTDPFFNTAARILGLRNHLGDLVLYRLPTLEELRRYRFAAPVSAVGMDELGRRLLVVTKQQIAYLLDVPR